MRLRSVVAAVFVGAVALVATGCGQTSAVPGSLPASAAAAPADALAFVSLDTDLGSEQWKNARALVDLFPSLRDTLGREIEKALQEENVTWKDDIQPALGREIVVLATVDAKAVVLLQPQDDAMLDRLLTFGDEQPAKRKVGDWTALAEQQGDIDAYAAGIARGTLDTVATFATAVEALPPEALVKAWVNGARLAQTLPNLARQAGELGVAIPSLDTGFDLGLDSIAMALVARDDGLYLTVDVDGGRLGNGTRYEPKLFANVPGDAVAALSFGGTQGIVDKIRGPLQDVSDTLESTVGVSLDKVLTAFSGEGVVYVRQGSGEVPEVSVVLAPPNVDETFGTIDTMMRTLAESSNATVSAVTVDNVPVTRIEFEGVPIFYGRLDDDTIIVTLGPDAIAAYTGSSQRLVDGEGFKRAADAVDLGDTTSGFLYVDLDGLIPLITGIGGAEALPVDARDVLRKLDSFILQSSSDGDGMRVSGFLRVNT